MGSYEEWASLNGAGPSKPQDSAAEWESLSNMSTPAPSSTQAGAAPPAAAQSPDVGVVEAPAIPGASTRVASPGIALASAAANTLGGTAVDTAKTLTAAAVGGIGGGLYGLYKLATEGPDAAAAAVAKTQEEVMLTHGPKTKGAQKVMEALGSDYNPMNWPTLAADWIAGRGVDVGALTPAEGAGIKTAGSAVAPGAVFRGATTIGKMLRPGAAAEAVAPAATPIKIGNVTFAREEPRALPPPAGQPAAQYGSVGASAATNAAAARTMAANLSPELRAAVEKNIDNVNPQVLTRHAEADSLPVPIRLTEGQATGDVGLLSLEMNRRGKHKDLADRFNEQNGQLIENLNRIRDDAAPDVFGVNHIENGASIIDAYKTMDAGIKARINAAYTQLRELNAGEWPLDGKEFVRIAEERLKRELKTDYVPAAIERQMNRYKAGEQMTFEQFEALRTNLAAEMRAADRAGNGNVEHAASIVRGALEELPMTNRFSEEIKQAADTARALAKARFDTIKKDPAYKAAINDVAPDAFIDKFLIRAPVRDVQTMIENLGRGTPAQQTMTASVVNWLKSQATSSAGDAGNFSQAAYNKALKSVDPKLLDIVGPVTKGQLETLGNVARYTQQQPRGSFVNTSNTLVGALAEHAKDAAAVAIGAKTGLGGAIPIMNTMLKNRAEANAVAKALEPGAGLTYSKAKK